MAKGVVVGLHTASTGVKKTVDIAAQKASKLSKADVSSFSSLSSLDQAKKLAELLGVDEGKLYTSQEVVRVRNERFERFAQNYVNSEPEILFTCDYIVDDKMQGCLVVWEKFFDSTHYEVFKKNLFKEDSEFERVLFLDVASLEEERVNFVDYLKNTVGLSVDEKNIYVMLDSVVKEDRIYEYKIVASRVPKNASEVDYDMILEGSDNVRKIAIDSTSKNNVFDVTANVLGSKDLAWTTCLLNEDLFFFGRIGIQKSVASLISKNSKEDSLQILMAADLGDILKIFNESVLLFGILPTMEKLIVQCNGLSPEFREVFIGSIDSTKMLFSYDKFRDGIKTISPVFKLVLDVAQSSTNGENNTKVTGKEALSKLSVVLPTDTGLQSITSIEGITNVLNFVNNVFLSVLYASEKSVFDALSSGTFLEDFAKSKSENNAFQEVLTGSGNKDNKVTTSSVSSASPRTKTSVTSKSTGSTTSTTSSVAAKKVATTTTATSTSSTSKTAVRKVKIL